MTRTWIPYLLLLVLPQVEVAQTNNGVQIANKRNQRHAAYVQLDRKIFAQHGDPESEKLHISEPDKVVEIRSQLHKLISDEINDTLNAPNPSEDKVVNAIVGIQGELTDKPFASFFKLNGMRSLAVSYVILQGGDAIASTQPYLEFYDFVNGAWQIKAEASTVSNFQGRTFCVSPLASGISGEAWFVAWGFTIGNPGTPVNVRLYGFDGNTVRTVWQRDDLTGGEVTVAKDSVTLEYDREYKSPDPNNHVQEVLHVTPNGLQ